MPQVDPYVTENGDSPFEYWLNSLAPLAAVKITNAVTRMELGNFGDNKTVGEGVRERRIDFQKGYRIYYAKEGVVSASDGFMLRFGACY